MRPVNRIRQILLRVSVGPLAQRTPVLGSAALPGTRMARTRDREQWDRTKASPLRTKTPQMCKACRVIKAARLLSADIDTPRTAGRLGPRRFDPLGPFFLYSKLWLSRYRFTASLTL